MVGRLNNLKDEMDELDGEWKYSLKTLKYSLKKSLAPLWMVSKFQIQTSFDKVRPKIRPKTEIGPLRELTRTATITRLKLVS